MTLHDAYQNGRMHAEVDILLSQSVRTQYRQLRYVDAWGDTALTLAMTLQKVFTLQTSIGGALERVYCVQPQF